MSASLPGLTIGRLVAHGRPDKLDLRMRLEAGLGLADIRARNLPPDAILCVRRLADPLPGHLPAQGGAMPPDRWRAAVAQRLDHLARVAARPAFGGGNEGTEAVLFASRAELLAALARDWLTHGRLDRWWWAHLTQPGAPATTVVNAWRTHPESLPAALDLLAAQSLAVALCGRLSTGEASDLLARVVRAYGIAFPVTIPAADQSVGHMPPPWESVVPEAVDGALSPETALLAGVSLTLARRPALARTRAFAAGAVAWAQEQHNLSGTRWNASQSPGPHCEDVASELPRTQPAIPGVGPLRATSGEQGMPGTLSLNRRALPDAPAEVPEVSRPQASVPSDDERATVADQSDSWPTIPDPLGSRHSTTHATTPSREDAAGFSPLLISHREVCASSFHTGYGGAFFLANVALALELYADFTRPADLGLDLDFWAFLLTASRDLLGGLPDDPLWRFMRELAGKEEDRPEPEATEWRIPPFWLDPVGTGAQWTYQVANGRLRVTHDLGFPTVDVPFTEEPTESAVRAVLQDYPPVPLVQRSGEATAGDPPSERIAKLVNPYIRIRLAQALAVPADEAGALLIGHPALVEAWPASIRVTFALEQHPIAIRLAGLDRDPGWIPAAGRSIAFAFEPASD